MTAPILIMAKCLCILLAATLWCPRPLPSNDVVTLNKYRWWKANRFVLPLFAVRLFVFYVNMNGRDVTKGPTTWLIADRKKFIVCRWPDNFLSQWSMVLGSGPAELLPLLWLIKLCWYFQRQKYTQKVCYSSRCKTWSTRTIDILKQTILKEHPDI